ncbi:MAG: hypothetical protein IJZ30_00805 [Alphaproteobacteria bacterium]|nr:hypothetical protein [Alphaproteobacteria bacterium]
MTRKRAFRNGEEKGFSQWRSGDLKDGYELDFARIDGALDEVLEERRMGYREPLSSNGDILKSNVKQSNALLPDDEDFSLEGLALSDRQKKAINKLDMANQLVIIKALREEQGVEKPKKETSETSSSELDVLREKVDKANREIKVANNEHERTKSDARYSNEQDDEEELKVDDNKFNQDFFINKTMRPFIETEEGLYDYPYLDTNGLITIGVGANIDDNPLSMDWYYKNPDTGKLRHLDKENPDDLRLIKEELSYLEKEREKLPYDEKKKTWENNYKAKHYKGITNLRVSSEYINREYYKRAKEAVNNIQNTIKRYNKDTKKEKDIPDFRKLPQPLQFVLMDMMYNMGQTRFDYIVTYGKDGKRRGYPSFWDAVANRDVDGMIKECVRNGLPERNKATQERLRKLKDVVY